MHLWIIQDSVSDTLVSAEFELASYHFAPELSAEVNDYVSVAR